MSSIVSPKSAAAAASGGGDETSLVIEPHGARLSLPNRLAAKWARLTQWEYWPSWVLYLPLVPHIAMLGLRSGGLGVCTRANPSFPLGGLVGESKWDILKLLPQESIIPSALLPPGPHERRVESVCEMVRERGWEWPIILKPEAGYRGTGVEVVDGASEVRRYLGRWSGPVLVQAFDPGPCEFGVFYVRLPGEDRGRIFSITEKCFAGVEGDGKRTIRELICQHPRYRVQAAALLVQLRERPDRVPGDGERVKVGMIGNHARGAMFVDGSRHITPALEQAIDSIAQRTQGFFFGRFDIRCSSEDEFQRGVNLRIVELNGLASESTNIYDPSWGFWRGQRVLRAQWAWAFRIGAANAKRGSVVPTLRSIIQTVRRELRDQKRRLAQSPSE